MRESLLPSRQSSLIDRQRVGFRATFGRHNLLHVTYCKRRRRTPLPVANGASRDSGARGISRQSVGRERKSEPPGQHSHRRRRTSRIEADVNPDGSKTWGHRYNDLAGGVKKQIKPGSCPRVTVSAARQRPREIRKLRDVGSGPREHSAQSRVLLVEAVQAKRRKDYTVAGL